MDANKGGATGKRTHKPIVIQTVDDQNKVSRTIMLTNAVISDFRKNGAIETFSFSYEKIEWQQ